MKISDFDSFFFARSAGLALLYFATAIAGLKYAVVGSAVTLVWAPSGIALVAILAYGFRMSFGIALGALLANLWMGLPILLATGIAIGNMLEAAAGAFLLLHLARFRNTLDRLQDIFALIVLAAIFSTTISAFIGVSSLILGGIVSSGEYASAWIRWWLGDMMGILVVAPPLLVWLNRPRPIMSTMKLIEAAALFVSLSIICQLIFINPDIAGHGYYPASLIVIPFVIWAALRFDHWGATLATLLISALAILGTTQGTGPFALGSISDSLVGWCIFVNLLAATGLLLAALSAAQRRDQETLKIANVELELGMAETEQTNQAMTSFIAAASHDLRQPMHAISLYVALLRHELAGREALITLDKIEAAVAAMEHMFSSILNVSKLEAGALVPEVGCVSAKDLLNGLYDEFRHNAEAKGLHLRLHYRAASVASDPVLLGRILRNLISNALRYTDHGGVLITARKFEGGIRFQIWDTGRGIPADHLEAIFEEHFQVVSPLHECTEGQGLGLAIVDRLTHLLGHLLTVHSRPGKGTVFSLDVPCCQDTPAQGGSGKETQAEIGRMHGLVAIVDNDAMVLDALGTLLDNWGLSVIKAGGVRGLLGELKRAPNLLITDYHLGTKDGLELVNTLRHTYPDDTFQVIIITGDTTEEGIRALNESGYPVLHKPVHPARLRALMTHLLL